jgi:hypothetical protein
VVRRKLDVLRRHCDAERRDPAEIEITTLSTANLEKQSPVELIGFCRELAEAGVQHAIFNMPGVDRLAPLDAFVETIIPEVAGF